MALNFINKALVGGIQSLQFIPVEGVDSFNLQSSTLGGPSAIILKAGFDWIDVPGVQGSMLYSENQELSAQGVRYAKDVRAFLAHDDFANKELLHSYVFAKLILKYRDYTGNLRICGSPAEPFRLQFDFTTAEFAGQIGFTVRLTGRHGKQGGYLVSNDSPLIWINEDGKLEISPALVGIISLDANGKLVANGADAASYSLSTTGYLVYT